MLSSKIILNAAPLLSLCFNWANSPPCGPQVIDQQPHMTSNAVSLLITFMIKQKIFHININLG